MLAQKGFTLTELLVSVAIGLILVTVAAPSLQDLLRNNRATAITNEFVTSLSFARSEAVRRASEVRISALNAGVAENEWGTGWRVWIDSDGDDTYDAGEELRVGLPLDGGAALDSLQDAVEIRFRGTGFTTIPAGQTRDFRLRLASCHGDQNRTISLTPTGRFSVARESCS